MKFYITTLVTSLLAIVFTSVVAAPIKMMSDSETSEIVDPLGHSSDDDSYPVVSKCTGSSDVIPIDKFRSYAKRYAAKWRGMKVDPADPEKSSSSKKSSGDFFLEFSVSSVSISVSCEPHGSGKGYEARPSECGDLLDGLLKSSTIVCEDQIQGDFVTLNISPS